MADDAENKSESRTGKEGEEGGTRKEPQRATETETETEGETEKGQKRERESKSREIKRES